MRTCASQCCLYFVFYSYSTRIEWILLYLWYSIVSMTLFLDSIVAYLLRSKHPLRTLSEEEDGGCMGKSLRQKVTDSQGVYTRVLPRPFPWVLMTLGLAVILGAILETGIAVAQQLPLSSEAMKQIQTLHDEKALRTPAQQKMKSNLVLETKMRRDTAIRRAVPALQTNIALDTEDKTLVDITAEVTAEVLHEIVALGGEVVNSFAQYRAIRARMPIHQLEALAGLPQVDSIRPADKAMTHVLNVSQGDVAQRANTARATFGVTGAGVRICVLSDSVDNLAAGTGHGRPAGGDSAARTERNDIMLPGSDLHR